MQYWTGEAIEVHYRAFFLNPAIPPTGYDFVPYMQAKFQGRMDWREALDAPRRLGAPLGLVFNMEKITKAPNTLLSHVLINLAEATTREAMVEAVYAAYFEHGQDIGDPETLVALGQAHGLAEASVRTGLAAPEHQRQVQAEAAEALRLNIQGVPFFIINEKYAFSGAQPPEVMTRVLNQVVERGG